MITTDSTVPSHRAVPPLPIDGAKADVDHRLRRFLTTQGATAALATIGLDVESVDPDYLRHKPGETTVVGYRVQPTSGPPTRAHLRWCQDPMRAEQLHRRALTLRPRSTVLGDGVARVDANTVLYTFPVDAELPRLRWWVDPTKIKRSLEDLGHDHGGYSGRRTRIEILRYKPERRVVARVDLVAIDGTTTPVLVRYGARPIGHRLAATAQALDDGGVGCPVPIAVRDEGRVTIDPFLPGQTLADAIRAGSADPFRTADALAGFHSVRSVIPGLGRRLPSDEADRANSSLRGLLALQPPLAELTASLGRTLAATKPSDPTPDRLRLVHGDLHPRNMMVDDGPTGSGRLWFIDLDRAAHGLPELDLAALLAQALAIEVRRPGWSPTALEHAESVIDRYRSVAGGGLVDEPTLAWYTSVALIDQALLVVRQLEPDAAAIAGLILKSAIDLVELQRWSGVPS